MSSPNQSPVPAYNRRVSYETRATTCLVVSLRYINLQLLLCLNKKKGVDITRFKKTRWPAAILKNSCNSFTVLINMGLFPYILLTRQGFLCNFLRALSWMKSFQKTTCLKGENCSLQHGLGKLTSFVPRCISRISLGILFSQKRYV